VNNRGQVAGHSDLKGNTTFHGFLWTDASGMVDLGALPGDPTSLANGINDAGLVVGASIGPGLSTFTAVRWDNGVIADLNKLVTANSAGLYLLVAGWVNSGGEITGVAAGSDGLHAFLATPTSTQNSSPAVSRPVLTGPARELVIRRSGLRLR
jgi:probable HAF family extracellular repeat protein